MRRCGANGAFAAYAFAMLCVLGGFASAAALARGAATPTTSATAAPWVCLLKVDGSINPAVAAFIEDGLGYASSQHAGALVIELDTPGGLLGSAQRIVMALNAAHVCEIGVARKTASANSAASGLKAGAGESAPESAGRRPR